MEEQASFEARAVLAPRRARLTRLALLVPVVALVVTAWAGLSGPRTDTATAEIAKPPDVAEPTLAVPVRPQRPARVIGFDVQRLDEVQPRNLGRDDLVAVAGWYVPTAMTDCPAAVALYRAAALPDRPDLDPFAYCHREGVLYASRPDIDASLPTGNLNETDRANSGGLPAVVVTFVIGVIMPEEFEVVGAAATEIVVIGHFVEFGDQCRLPACGRRLLVDYVGWTPAV